LRFDDELTELRPRIRALEADSELNVTFASAVLLGLTFLIPVFLYEKRRVRAKQRLETLRKRIAADLHDDVGGNLGSISLIARSARRGLEKIPVPTDFTSDLHEVELIARESSLAMRDIVWLIEQRDDSVGDLVARMRETGARMLREVEYSLACASVRTDSRLSLDFKRHFFLFFKEALHNVLKHSQARRVAILIDDDGDELVLEIQDDGVGMPQEVADDPNTSRKLRQRAEIIGGKFSITSSVDNGTCIRLMIHVKRLTATSPTP
jgi:signal transduction histidine kinase